MAGQHAGSRTSVDQSVSSSADLGHPPLAKTPLHYAAPLPSAPEVAVVGDTSGRDCHSTSILHLWRCRRRRVSDTEY